MYEDGSIEWRIDGGRDEVGGDREILYYAPQLYGANNVSDPR